MEALVIGEAKRREVKFAELVTEGFAGLLELSHGSVQVGKEEEVQTTALTPERQADQLTPFEVVLGVGRIGLNLDRLPAGHLEGKGIGGPPMGRLLERKLHDVGTKGITVPVVAVLLEFNLIEGRPAGQKSRLKISHPDSSSGALVHERLSEVLGQVGTFEEIIVNRFGRRICR